MGKSDYSHFGRRIKRAVRDAMRSGDFGNIGRAVGDTVQEVADEVNDTFSGQGCNDHHAPHPYTPNGQQNGGYYGYTTQAPTSPQGRAGPVPPEPPVYHGPDRDPDVWQRRSRRRVHTRGLPGSVSGMLCSVLGMIIGVPLLIADIALLATFAISGVTAQLALIDAAVFLPATVASFGCAGYGGRLRRRVHRFGRYRAALGGAAFSQVAELAETAGETPARTVKDLKKMITVGVYPNGHLDQEETCFMVDDETYQEYLDAEKAHSIKEQEARAKEEKKKTDPKSAELEAVRREGNEYLLEIRTANDEIPDEAVSGKLYQLESVTGRIFQCVEQHPQKLPDIRKFMRYYLPTTLKLVKSYQEFVKQPVQGENIRKAKEEIEHALDTINVAFANLLDSLFEDEAFDVSTDISTLETMLKQEGLTGSDFKQQPEKDAAGVKLE